jgi:hypothetical protein
MSAQISLNPMATTNALGLFSTNSNGFTQGDAQDDPAVKFALAGGVLSTAATAPVWGGIPVQEFAPANNSNVLGSTLLQATTTDVPQAIVVFNQAFAGITTPSSTAPLYSPGMSVNYYRFGSGARIPLALDPASVTLEGDLVSTTVYFNYTTNLLTTTQPSGQAALPVKVLRISTQNNKTVSYSSVTGNANWATDGLIALVQI